MTVITVTVISFTPVNIKRVPDHRHMTQLKEFALSSFYIIVFFTELVDQETKLTVKTKTQVAAAFERMVALKTKDPDKMMLLLFLFLRI